MTLWSREEYNQLIEHIGSLRGSTFVRSSGFPEGKSNHFIIEYFQNFDNYKDSNPSTTLQRKDFDRYFQTSQTCDKILTLESMRILRKFPQIQVVEIYVPPFGLYSGIKVDRKIVPTIISPNPLDQSQESAWQSFVDHVGYDRKMRVSFLKVFGIRTSRAEFN